MASNCPQVTAEDAQRPLFAGVDLGGTGIKIGLVDDRGSYDWRNTNSHGPGTWSGGCYGPHGSDD